MMRLTGKVAAVTGGARGIGKAIVLAFAKEGADIAFTYFKSSAEQEALVEEVRSLGRHCVAVQTDVRDFNKAKEFIETVKRELGQLDIVVNNAGITKDKALMMMSGEEWKDVLETNLDGTFNVTRHAIVTFLKQKSGVIINITSVSGVIGLARQTNYSASKAGIIGFTRSLAREVAGYNIRVNAVAPGFIDTDMIAGLKPEHKERIMKAIPLARLGSAEEVAGAVVFLASQDSRYITGQTVVMDGGLSINISS